MMNNQHLLQQEIERDSSLPVLPPNITQLLKVLTNNDIPYTQLASELENFPSIAVKIVGTANSAWASPSIPITTLRDSCSRIGVPLVRSIAIALSVSQVFNPSRCSSFDPQVFWISARLTAEAAHLRAKSTADVCPDTARLVGLIHNMGLLWLADKKPVETASAISTSQNDHVSLTRTLYEKYDLDLYSIGSHLATSMELPEIMAAAIANRSINNTHTSDDPLINNHFYACQMAASVLSLVDLDNKENPSPDDIYYFDQLTKKLPEIKSMAQILFFN